MGTPHYPIFPRCGGDILKLFCFKVLKKQVRLHFCRSVLRKYLVDLSITVLYNFYPNVSFIVYFEEGIFFAKVRENINKCILTRKYSTSLVYMKK
jgi:hypothetical protein